MFLLPGVFPTHDNGVHVLIQAVSFYSRSIMPGHRIRVTSSFSPALLCEGLLKTAVR